MALPLFFVKWVAFVFDPFFSLSSEPFLSFVFVDQFLDKFVFFKFIRMFEPSSMPIHTHHVYEYVTDYIFYIKCHILCQ